MMSPASTIRPIPEDRAEWLRLRRRYVGASEVAALFNAQPAYAMGVYALWMVKAGRMEPPDVSVERAAWGLRLENAIAEAAAEREGWRLLLGVYATRGGLGATLDRCIAEATETDRAELGEHAEGPGVLELKNVDWLVHRRGWKDEPPLHVLLQLQAQLYAVGYRWGAVAALVGGNDLRIYRYAARPALHAEMERRVAEFWRSIDEDQPPAPDGSDATYRALVDMCNGADDEPADFAGDNEAPVLAERYAAVTAQISALEKERAELRNRLIEKLGGHRYGYAGEWRIAAAYSPGRPERRITPDMVGQVLPGRAASVRLIVTQEKQE
jgi:predicted phage-related endonuclease